MKLPSPRNGTGEPRRLSTLRLRFRTRRLRRRAKQRSVGLRPRTSSGRRRGFAGRLVVCRRYRCGVSLAAYAVRMRRSRQPFGVTVSAREMRLTRRRGSSSEPHGSVRSRTALADRRRVRAAVGRIRVAEGVRGRRTDGYGVQIRRPRQRRSGRGYLPFLFAIVSCSRFQARRHRPTTSRAWRRFL
jgi:hypothetical protein